MIGLCAICANDRDGDVREVDGRRVFVCDRCEHEHPRSGGYLFSDIGRDRCHRKAGGGRALIAGSGPRRAR